MRKRYTAYKIELKPNNKQKSLFMAYSGMRRYAWNWALERINKREIKANEFDLHKAWNVWKKENIPWWKGYSKAVPQESFEDIQKAFSKFFKGLKQKTFVGRPKFRKRSSDKSFRLIGVFGIKSNQIRIPRIGWARLKEKNYLPLDSHIVSTTIKERAGKWFISVMVEDKSELPNKYRYGKVIGIDLGINKMATLSDGRVFKNIRSFKSLEKRLRKVNKRLSRQKKGSKRRDKTKLKLRKLYHKIACVRNDHIHKTTTEIARTKQLSKVVLEDLNVSGMVKNKKLSKSILDVSFFEFKRQVLYKAERFGFVVELADRFYPSTKLCSVCGNKKDMSLSDRIYNCDKCSNIMDRDLNAAINLMNYTPPVRRKVNVEKI